VSPRVRRIAITGIGAIAAHGSGVAAFERGLRDGRCAVRAVTIFPTEGYRTTIAAEVPSIELPAELPSPLRRRASRSAAMALIAAAEAVGGARLDAAGLAGAGVVLGTTTGGTLVGEESYRATLQGEPGRRRLSQWLETPVAASVDALARAFGAGGPRLTVATACSSGANAIGIAADWIRAGRVATALCGGTDALCRMTFSGFNSLQALDRQPCRPFDRERAGLTLGEGAAVLVLEDWQAARARGAEILAEFLGYGVSADAHHLTQPRPDGEGAAMAMRRALAEAGVTAEEIDYVNAHGTGTPQNDVTETRALKAVLGARAAAVPVSSTKSMIGHCLGAAGALEALACVLALRGGFVPPTANLVHPDPECDLDYVAGASRPARLRTVLSNSYGFGGNNTSLVLRGVE